MPESPKRILILRFSALGDVIQTLPILTWLRSEYPDAVIGWAIDEELASAVEGHPALNYLHRIPRKRWSRSFRNPGAWLGIRREFLQYINEIKAVGYDLAIDPQSLFKTSFVAFCAGIKRRIGYGHDRELSGLFLNERHLTRSEYFDHEVLHMEHLAQLAQAAGCRNTEIDIEAPPVPPDITDRVSAMIAEGFAGLKPIVALAPGTQWSSKLWPDEYWVSLVDKILTNTDLNVLLVGSKGDASLCEGILRAFPSTALHGRVLNIAGRTNIREMYAVYRHVTAAIGADSAPQHIAGAVKIPLIVGLFGPTSYKRTPPVGSEVLRTVSSQGTLDCQPCHKKTCPLGTTECMKRVTPDMVFTQLLEGMRAANHPVVAHAGK